MAAEQMLFRIFVLDPTTRNVLVTAHKKALSWRQGSHISWFGYADSITLQRLQRLRCGLQQHQWAEGELPFCPA